MSETGGYKVELVLPIQEGYRCPYCDLLMRDPIQTLYGERLCRSCYSNVSGASDESMQIFTDKLAQREINNLDCYCKHKPRGCNWSGKLMVLEEHLRECDYRPVQCHQCLKDVTKCELEDHKVKFCPQRVVSCKHCKIVIPANVLEGHERNCPEMEIDCQYQCGKKILRKEYGRHLNRCEEFGKGKHCPFNCDEQFDDLSDHMIISLPSHCNIIIGKVGNLSDRTSVLGDQLIVVANKCNNIENELNEMKTLTEGLKKELEEYTKKYQDLHEQYNSYQKQAEKEVNRLKDLLIFPESKDSQEVLKRLGDRCDEADEKLKKLDEVLEQLFSGDTKDNLKSYENKVKSNTKKIDQIERENAVLNATVSDLELKVKLLNTRSYDGNLLWRVDKVHYRRECAINGKNTAIHSPVCFTERGGYKFCTRLYLNGDGMGKGTHLSLFFVLMKSDFDVLQTWPFTYRVSFELIHPKNEKLSYREAFIPEKNSASFKRPTKEMNVAAGCPMFVQIDTLLQTGFIVDDCIFIKTEVKNVNYPTGAAGSVGSK